MKHPVYSTTDFLDFHKGTWKKGYCVTKSGKRIPDEKTIIDAKEMVSRKTCKVICKKRKAKGCEFNQVNKKRRGWCASFTVQVKASKKDEEILSKHINIFEKQSCLSL